MQARGMFAQSIPIFSKRNRKLLHDMSNARIIRANTSAFLSPVLLVKKKDDSWLFYLDYKALNNIAIKYRFPVPTIDELLDELHRSKFSLSSYGLVTLRFEYMRQTFIRQPSILMKAIRVHYYAFLALRRSGNLKSYNEPVVYAFPSKIRHYICQWYFNL